MITATKQLDQQTRKLFTACSRNGMGAADREKAKNQVSSMVKALTDEEFRAIINLTATYFLSRERMQEIGQPQDFPVSEFLRLGDYGFASSSEFGFADSPKAFESLPAEMMLEHSLPPKHLDLTAKRQKDFISKAVAVFSENPSKADKTRTFDWVIQKAKPKELIPLLTLLFTNRERRGHLKSYETLCGELFERDKSGIILIEGLKRIGNGELDLELLGRTLVKTPKAAGNFLRLSPKILSKPKSEEAVKLLKIILEGLLALEPSFRSEVSGHLAVLAGELLRKSKRKPAEEEALELIARSAGQLLSSSPDAREGFCFLVFSKSPTGDSTSGRQLIHPDGADILLAALPKIKDATFDAATVLEATITNLGIERLEEQATTVHFNPAQHEDTVGGLLPNEPCRVLECGWQVPERILIRAKVSPV